MNKPVTKTSWQVLDGQEVLGHVRRVSEADYVARADGHDIGSAGTLHDAAQLVWEHRRSRFSRLEVD